VWAEPQHRARIIEQLQSMGGVFAIETVFNSKSGPRDVHISAELVELDGRACIVAVTEDVTDAKRQENQYRQIQKMEATGRLAGGIAHDFNNVLNVILGYCELLLDRTGPADPSRKQIEQIESAAKRAADLTRQLLAFGRQQVLQAKVLD